MDFREELAAQVENDYMACIGCNDCMLACPLPQTANISIAELNYAVQQEVITNPRVIEFVTACTQCRQCVPVCPADLSRADMVLFNKVKVEDRVPDGLMMLQVGREVVPSEWTLNNLSQHLSRLGPFEGVALADIRRLALKVTLRQLGAEETLTREGEYHERLFIVLDGLIEQSVRTERGSIQILRLGPGTFHGELAVLANQPEPFTLTALQRSIVIEIPKVALYQMMEQVPVFGEMMRALYNRRAIWEYARHTPVLADLPESALEELFALAELRTLRAGEALFRQGDMPRSAYLVRNGFLKVTRQLGDYGERVLLYFREGDNFGFLPVILGEQRHEFGVSASTQAEVIELPGAVLVGLLAKHPAARQALLKAADQSEQLARSAASDDREAWAVDGGRPNTTQLSLSWTSLLDKGVLQGHEVLVIDQSICTNCNNCVDACGERHGYSRLERSGLQLGNFLFPSACRHCEDPVCLLCSVNGIVRLPNGEITIVQDNCIGCGSCANRCPYNNINMHAIQQQVRGSFLKSLLASLGQRGRTPELEIQEEAGPRLAVKCDLCAGHADYACVTACPVGAAFRIDPVEVFQTRDLHIGLEMKGKTNL